MFLSLIVYTYKINSYLISPGISTCLISRKYLPSTHPLLFLSFPEGYIRNSGPSQSSIPAFPPSVVASPIDEHHEILVYCPLLMRTLTSHGKISSCGLSPGGNLQLTLRAEHAPSFFWPQNPAPLNSHPFSFSDRRKALREPFPPLVQNLIMSCPRASLFTR